ncbi:FtsB family cell division protein [Amphibiibacter pelophylacis]|uniref:Septum formation initiator family protein n=1 Tax=Amphibiibacter pelophylacis TaxID=1799477 RepID=A0ACC6P067_9BURK
MGQWMMNRGWPLLLLVLLVLVGKSLFWGDSSYARIQQMSTELATQVAINDQAQQRNAQLQAEISDLGDGLEMAEEKARSELGMVKPNEIRVIVSRQP